MPDASTAQLVTVAVISAVGGGGLTALTKLGEFRREDRARWLAERRDAYVRLIDALAEMTDAAMVASITAEAEGNEGNVVKACDVVCDRFQDAQAPIATLRLLAPDHVAKLLDPLSIAAGAVAKHYIQGAIGGVLEDDHLVGEDLRTQVRRLVEEFTAAARRDVRA